MKKAFSGIRILLIIGSLWITFGSLLWGQNHRLVEHQVAQGETVFAISRQYHILVEDIYRENPSAVQGIQVGQILKIPVPQKVDAELLPKGLYVVRPGDTLYGTSKKFGVKISELIEWNNGLSESSFKAGEVIAVSQEGASKLPTLSGKSNSASTAMSSASFNKVLKMALILPVAEQGPQRYIDFYEGMLLALWEQKQAGVSLDLQVLQAVSLPQYHSLVEQGLLNDCDMIIGGDSEASVDLLATFASKNQKIYISPFVKQASSAYSYPYFYQINPSKSELISDLASAFSSYFKDSYILFVTSSSPNQISTQTALLSLCQKNGIPYGDITMDELRAGKFPKYKGKTIVLVPDNSSKDSQLKLFEYMDSYFEKNSGENNFRIFGYSEWQSYGKEFLSRLHRYRGVIFTTFYFDSDSFAGKTFARKYQDLFDKPLAEGYPRYSVLGYDLASYMIPAFYASPLKISSYRPSKEGLQSNFSFRSFAGHKSQTHRNFFFVEYERNGDILRKSFL